MMKLMIIAVLVLLGLCFGSFVNALVWRLHQQHKTPSKKQRAKYSLSKGRSMCVHCGHTLTAQDLIPVLSWLSLGGKCRYCHKPISWQYPLVELATVCLFILSYIYWSQPLTGLQVFLFTLWLACQVGLVALVVYDLRWMLLPNRIIFPLYGVATAFIIAQIIEEGLAQPLLRAMYGVLIGGGIFYLLFQFSEGRWIGGGDVKLGFLLGALVGGPAPALLVLFVASLIGSLVSVPLIVGKKASRSTRIPFGPFLIASAVIVQLFGQHLINWYSGYLLY